MRENEPRSMKLLRHEGTMPLTTSVELNATRQLTQHLTTLSDMRISNNTSISAG